MGAKRLPDDRAPSIAAPSGAAKLRIVMRLLTTPRGNKATVARQLASECGRNWRSVYRWQQVYCQHGFPGLAHSRRSDKGFPQLYSPPEFESVVVAAGRLRRNPRCKIRREFAALGLPGSYETFRFWVRRLQIYGFVETSPVSEREALRA
jgi:hypothetical protein